VPDLFLAIKHEVDIDPRRGRFLLTGSARLLGIPDLLPGRAETIELSPLSQGEIDRSMVLVTWSRLVPATRDPPEMQAAPYDRS
jgi:predicted AAA+ superfamily ATPase